MTYFAETLELATRGRGTHDITREVQRVVGASGTRRGLCTVFVHHTSASLIINENADPNVHVDLNAWLARLVRDGDPLFVHTEEGPDDMSAHVRVALTQTSLNIPVESGRADLGTWQGVYLWEHRTRPHTRRVTISVVG